MPLPPPDGGVANVPSARRKSVVLPVKLILWSVPDTAFSPVTKKLFVPVGILLILALPLTSSTSVGGLIVVRFIPTNRGVVLVNGLIRRSPVEILRKSVKFPMLGLMSKVSVRRNCGFALDLLRN